MKIKNSRKLAIAMSGTLLAAIFGVVMLKLSTASWDAYQEPSYTPSPILIDFIRITVYLLLGRALYGIWMVRGRKKEVQTAIKLFLSQIVLSALWFIAFYFMVDVRFAFFTIAAIGLSVLATMRVFWRLNKTSVLFELPFFIWIIFVGVLNYEAWRVVSPTEVDLFGVFLTVAGFVIGLGAVTVIDMHGFLGRKSEYWTEATTRTHRVTKALIWLGTFMVAFGGWIAFRHEGWTNISGLIATIFTVLIANGLYLSFVVSPYLLKREEDGHAKKILPKSWQRRIFGSFIISFLGWWSALFLFVYWLMGCPLLQP